MVDAHQHQACNGILLCTTCHQWVHAHPFEARKNGWIVSRHVAEPCTIPLLTAQHGWVTLNHDGQFTPSGLSG